MKNIEMHELKEIYNVFNKLYLYGASVTGEGILKLLHGAGIKVEAFIDRDESKYEKPFCGKDVIPAKDVSKNSCIIITASQQYHETVARMFEEEYGISHVYVLVKENRIAKYLQLKGRYDKAFILDYERKYNEIIAKYEKIEMYFIYADRIGEFIYRYINMAYELENIHDKVYRIIMLYTVDDADVANSRLVDMIKRQIHVVYGDNVGFWNYLIEKHQSEIINWEECFRYDKYDKVLHPDWKKAFIYNSSDTSVITFSNEEIKDAEAKADKIGINKKFVCVFARDSKYLGRRGEEGKAYSYHNYRDFDVNTYKLLADYLKEKDMQVIRVGNVQEGKLQGSNVIDITGENYDELLDLYVNSKCEYWIGCNCGAEAISGIFRKKKICVNMSHIINVWWTVPYCIDTGCMYIPKLYYSDKEKRYLTLREMCMLNISETEPWLYYENFGIKFIENTPEDILELYKECELKTCGEWEYTEERNLQESYNNVLNEVCNENKKWHDNWGYSMKDCIIPLPIGTSFLKKYKEFLLP